MTPVVLLILVVMWVAVLLPPYLRNRGESRPSSSMTSFKRKLDVLERQAPGRSSRGHVTPYLPVTSTHVHAAQPADGPLPEGSRHPLTHGGRPRLVPMGSSVNQSSSVRIQRDDTDPRLLLAPEADLQPRERSVSRNGEVPSYVLSRRAARKRRRDILFGLIGSTGVTLVLSIGIGGMVFFLFLLSFAALAGYVFLLIQMQKSKAEAEIKVAFLPHQNAEAEPSKLLETGGGFKPGDLLQQSAT